MLHRQKVIFNIFVHGGYQSKARVEGSPVKKKKNSKCLCVHEINTIVNHFDSKTKIWTLFWWFYVITKKPIAKSRDKKETDPDQSL